MKRYTIQIVIEEGHDEFWESLNDTRTTGCDEVLEMVRRSLEGTGLYDGDVQLVEFTDKG